MDWKEENNKLVKAFKLKSFSSIITKFQELSVIADQLDHHPDFRVYGYNNILFELNTHDSDSITDLDYELAKKIDQIFE